MTQFKLPVIGALILLAGFAVASPCEPDPKLMSYGQWIASTSLAAGKPFSVSSERRKAIEAKYASLSLGMSRPEVSALLGKPDYQSIHSSIGAKLGDKPAPYQRCDYQWAYVFSKKDNNPFSADDEGFFLMF